MEKSSKIAFKLFWSIVLICFVIQFLDIAIELLNDSYDNIFCFLGVIAGLLFFLTFFIGYIVSHIMIGPWLFAKHGHRSFRESYLWIGNCIFTEIELRELSVIVDDPDVKKTLRLISFSKYSIIVNLVLLVTFFILSN